MYVWHIYQNMHTELHGGLHLIHGSIPPPPVKSQHYRVTRNPKIHKATKRASNAAPQKVFHWRADYGPLIALSPYQL